ncbi:MAG TPA: hypothetical protein VF376_03820 [Thermoanaerobaculia bacterium]
MVKPAGRQRLLGLVLLGLAALCASASGSATKIWVSDTAADFSSGEARGVAVATEGLLRLTRDAKHVDGISEATIFAAARQPDGAVLLATGDAGKVLRVSPSGKVDTFATLPEKEVTALTVAEDGAVFAATAPGAKVYRIESGRSSVYYAPKAEYVWSLALSGPVLYVATGLPGEIHRVTASGKGERIHQTSDPHVRRLAVDSKGRVWAGTSGSGLLLRIDPSGKVATLYDSSKSEITAIAPGRGGRVWVAAGSGEASATTGEPISAPSTPAPPKTSRSNAAHEDEEGKEKAEVTVTVGPARLAPSHTSNKGGYSSELLLFEEGEPPRTVWTSSEELILDLEAEGDKASVLAATGPNGKLYRIGLKGWALERTFDEKQVSAFGGEAVATNSASGLYLLTEGPRSGEYVSAVKDTGRTSRFGAFRWEGELPPGTGLSFAFRSGESATPDSTWSAWSAPVSAMSAQTPAPEGRYIQWKVKMTADGGRTPEARRVDIAYRNRNAFTSIDALTVLAPAEVLARSASGGSNVFESTTPDEKGIFTSLEEPKSESAPRRVLRKGYRTITWKGSDPDGDVLAYDLDFRQVGADRWLPLRKGLRENFYSFDTTALPDGDYVFRLTASDAEANPEDPKTTARETSAVRVDNTPPVIRRLQSNQSGVFEFEAADAASPILEAEYSVDAKEWVKVEPKDGLSDSPTETYSIKLDPKWRGGFLLLRVMDAARNVAAASFTIP